MCETNVGNSNIGQYKSTLESNLASSRVHYPTAQPMWLSNMLSLVASNPCWISILAKPERFMKAFKSYICFHICSRVLNHYALFCLENTRSSVTSCSSITSCCVFSSFLKLWLSLLQKPGGIIALLDEAWYSKIFSLQLLFSVSSPTTIIMRYKLTFIISAACYPNQLLKHFLRSCIKHSGIISVS